MTAARPLPQGYGPVNKPLRAKRWKLFKKYCPDFPLTLERIDELCVGIGAAACCPVVGPKGAELLTCGGTGPMTAHALARALTEACGGSWQFWYDPDWLGGCILAVPSGA